jgi:chromosome segregation ATPase
MFLRAEGTPTEECMATLTVDASPIEGLERKLEDLLARYERSKQENAGLRQEITNLKDEIVHLNSESKQQRQEIAALKSEIVDLKNENASLKAEGSSLKSDRDVIKERINKLLGQVEEHLTPAA